MTEQQLLGNILRYISVGLNTINNKATLTGVKKIITDFDGSYQNRSVQELVKVIEELKKSSIPLILIQAELENDIKENSDKQISMMEQKILDGRASFARDITIRHLFV